MKFHIVSWLLTAATGHIATGEAWVQVGSSSLHSRTTASNHCPRGIRWSFAEWRQRNNRVSSSSRVTSFSTLSNHENLQDSDLSVHVPDFVSSPVLRQVYPHMIEYQRLHGHVNIPLGSTAGRQCQTLRRLQLQQKLTAEEVELLNQLQFRFTTLDDIYFQVPFDEMFQRLLDYEQQHPGTGYQIPKKYPPDPELGAWVTGIRRLAPHLTEDNVDEESSSSTTTTSKRNIHPDHVDRLNAIGFSWKSERKCGSKFMQFYRQLLQRIQDETEQLFLESNDGSDVEIHNAIVRHQILQDPSVQAWIAAQRETFHRGTMSETRQHYMTTLVGDESWKEKPNP